MTLDARTRYKLDRDVALAGRPQHPLPPINEHWPACLGAAIRTAAVYTLKRRAQHAHLRAMRARAKKFEQLERAEWRKTWSEE